MSDSPLSAEDRKEIAEMFVHIYECLVYIYAVQVQAAVQMPSAEYLAINDKIKLVSGSLNKIGAKIDKMLAHD